MNMIVTAGRLLLFFISNLGMWEYFRRKSKMHVFFLPAFTVCLQITVLFCAGLLNCLRAAALLLFCIGVMFAAYYLYQDLKTVICIYWNAGYAFLILAFILVLIACRGNVFTEYDNFSHWALAAKTMILNNRYPSFQDPVILFQEYPLGSASYVYYFAKIVSDSEAAQMAAQAFLMLCFILPAGIPVNQMICRKFPAYTGKRANHSADKNALEYKHAKRKIMAGFGCVLLFTNYIFCYNILIANLLVDTLLPLQGAAMLLFICWECTELSDGKNSRGGVCGYYVIPFLCTAVQIKNSGIYFVLLACILLGVSIKSDRSRMKERLVAIASPFFSLWLWHAHCSYVFSSGSVTKHAMTVQNYRNVFSQKAESDIASVLNGIVKFTFTGKELYDMCFFLVLSGILACAAGSGKKYLKILLASAVIYITYMAGVAGMYLFSMPGEEALNLSGIGRYRKTIFILLYYFLFVFLLELMSAAEKRKKSWICIAGIYFALAAVWRGEWGKAFPTIFDQTVDERRNLVEEAIKDSDLLSESSVQASYLICASADSDVSYMWHLGRYLFGTDKVSSRVITEQSDLEDAGNYEYILILDPENEQIGQWILEYYPDQEKSPVISTAR